MIFLENVLGNGVKKMSKDIHMSSIRFPQIVIGQMSNKKIWSECAIVEKKWCITREKQQENLFEQV